MKTLSKRLAALEGVRASVYDHWTDEQLIDRLNEITTQLRPFGLDFPMLDGGPDDLERLRITRQMLAKEKLNGVFQTTH